jgi:hypothetical protein
MMHIRVETMALGIRSLKMESPPQKKHQIYGHKFLIVFTCIIAAGFVFDSYLSLCYGYVSASLMEVNASPTTHHACD